MNRAVSQRALPLPHRPAPRQPSRRPRRSRSGSETSGAPSATAPVSREISPAPLREPVPFAPVLRDVEKGVEPSSPSLDGEAAAATGADLPGEMTAGETARRRRLVGVRRQLEAFEVANRYQSELKGTTLAMIAYMDEHWCRPERAADFDRWWRFVERYTAVLTSGELAGPGTFDRLESLLNENQQRPSDLQEQWLPVFEQKRRSPRKRAKSVENRRI